MSSKKKCFVICPIGDEGTPTRFWADNVLECIITPALNKFQYELPIRADKISTPGNITPQVIEHLFESDLVIADMTDFNPNVFYELAIRHMSDKPVIHMIKEGQNLPFDNQDYRTIFFEITAKNAHYARKELEKQIESIERGEESYNPITTARIVSKWKTSESVDEQFKAEMFESVSSLNNKVEELTRKLVELKSQPTYPYIKLADMRPATEFGLSSGSIIPTAFSGIASYGGPSPNVAFFAPSTHATQGPSTGLKLPFGEPQKIEPQKKDSKKGEPAEK